MALFERFFGKNPEEQLKEFKKDNKSEKEAVVSEDDFLPETASHEEMIRAWHTQPDANDPSSRAADRVVLKRIEDDEQAKRMQEEEKEAK